MKALSVSVLVLAAVAVSSPAAAGGYVAAGVGSDAALTGGLGRHFDTSGKESGRFILGMRHGSLALEASLFGTELAGASAMTKDAMVEGPARFSALSLGVDLKYHLDLFLGLEGYGRAGLSRTWLGDGPGSASRMNYDGRGYALGGGLQYAIRSLPLAQAALWLDYTRHTPGLEDDRGSEIDGDAHMVMLGLSLGTDL